MCAVLSNQIFKMPTSMEHLKIALFLALVRLSWVQLSESYHRVLAKCKFA